MRIESKVFLLNQSCTRLSGGSHRECASYGLWNQGACFAYWFAFVSLVNNLLVQSQLHCLDCQILSRELNSSNCRSELSRSLSLSFPLAMHITRYQHCKLNELASEWFICILRSPLALPWMKKKMLLAWAISRNMKISNRKDRQWEK